MAAISLSPDERGDQPLWRVFWLQGVLASHAFFAVILMLYAQLPTAGLAFMLAAFMLYTVVIVRSVWINAGNTREPLLGEIARFLTVAWALNAVLVSSFLLLDHLGATDPRLPLPF